MNDLGSGVVVTRIGNSCVLLQFGAVNVLTDPWFTEHWYIHRDEPLGMTIEELPPLDAIVVSHPFVNHWDRRALRRLPDKGSTKVFVPTARMAGQARSLGFTQATRLEWGQSAELGDEVRVEAVEAQRTALGRNNNYVLSGAGVRVFFGGEANETAPLVDYGRTQPPVDVALLPVNGLCVPVVGRIVMGPAEAVAGAHALGGRILVPIHDAHADEWPWKFIQRTGTAADAERLAAAQPSAPDVLNLPTGRPWRLSVA
jgi:L-ascorbate metabolism protein UlaG (beta-lactamase superfamily)